MDNTDYTSFSRRTFILLPLAFTALAGPTFGATPAETFISQNIQKGFSILNNKQLSTQQRKAQFQTFLLGITDMKRIAEFTLGQYRRGASPTDVVAFDAAFQNYAVAFYQSYFAKYSGQTLKVTGSKERMPGDFIITTILIDPNDHSGQPPLEVDFQVNTDTGMPVVLDARFSGISLAIMQRDQMVSILGNNHGSIPKLVSQLGVIANTLN